MPNQPLLSPPEEPGSRSQHALHELVAPGTDTVRTEGRLRALLEATHAVIEPIELPLVLDRIVRAAVELVDARYGSVGTVAPEGGVEDFIQVGMPRADRRSVDFPVGHRPIDEFLNVPIRVRDEVLGNLYLSDPVRGAFTAEDAQLMTALAATAGSAIAHARLFEEIRVRQSWMASAAEIASALLDTAGSPALPMLADELIARTAAERICIVLPGDDPLTVRVAEARGAGAADLAGAVIPAMATVAGLVLESRESRTCNGGTVDAGAPDALAIVDGDAAGPAMFVALPRAASVWGVLVVARRPGERQFSTSGLAIADDLASRVGLALELADAREERQRAMLVEERSRIARDLHDHVIQQLFGTGLELQALGASASSDDVGRRLQASVETLDDSIAQIRAIIFALRPREASAPSLRQRVIDIAAGYSASLPRPVMTGFSGPVDLVVTGSLADDVAAVARELLANVVKHAEARTVRLTIVVANDVGVAVEDDGVGIPVSGRRSGLANLVARADRRGGLLEVDSEPGRTRVEWRVPAGRDEGRE